MMNYWNNWDMMHSGWGLGSPFMGGGWLILILLWTFVWKGLALWKSARNDQRYWFVALLVINTLGILEILYLFVFAKEKLSLIAEPPKKSSSRARRK